MLRPLLAVRWVEAGKGVPPMRFTELLAGSELDAPLRQEIDDLLERKQRAGKRNMDCVAHCCMRLSARSWREAKRHRCYRIAGKAMSES